MTKTFDQSPSWSQSATLKSVLDQCYLRSVKDPSKLGKNKSHDKTYGEATFETIEKMIYRIDYPLPLQSTFLDLGSGVGTVVLQAAAQLDLGKAVGIEKLEAESEYAQAMLLHFEKLMKFLGKKHSKVEFIQGSFLNEAYKEHFQSASLVFVNNDRCWNGLESNGLNQKLNDMYAELLPDGAQVVSSDQFAFNKPITDKNLDDINSIVSSKLLFQGTVSWKHELVDFYHHVIDRSKLERYFSPPEEPEARAERIKNYWASRITHFALRTIGEGVFVDAFKKLDRLVSEVLEKANFPDPDLPKDLTKEEFVAAGRKAIYNFLNTKKTTAKRKISPAKEKPKRQSKK